MELDTIKARGMVLMPTMPIGNNIPQSMEKVTMNQKGIEAVAKAMDFIGTGAQAVKDIMQDGKVTISDSVYILPVAMKIGGVLKTITDVPAELKDKITPEEKAVLLETLKGMSFMPADMNEEKLDRLVSWIVEGKNILTDFYL